MDLRSRSIDCSTARPRAESAGTRVLGTPRIPSRGRCPLSLHRKFSVEAATLDGECCPTRGCSGPRARLTPPLSAAEPQVAAGTEVFMRRDRTLSTMLIVMGLLVAKPSVGDMVAYGEVGDLRAEGSEFIVDHHHDWSGSTRKRRSMMMATHQNPFTSENNYAYVSAKKKDTGVLLFRRPSPALSWIGVTADSRYSMQAREKDLTSPVALPILGLTLAAVGKQSEARDIVRYCIERWSDNADCYEAYGLILQQERNLAAAIRAWERSVELDPNDKDTWRYLAGAYREKYGA